MAQLKDGLSRGAVDIRRFMQVILRDGTHLPCDRLREATKAMKNLQRMAEKRLEAEQREQRAFFDHAMGHDHRGHPLRKDGFYTKYLWRPLHQHTIEEMRERHPQRIPTAILEARDGHRSTS